MSRKYRRATPEIAASTRNARSILLIEIGGLGDLVHSLPAMWAVRQAYPEARLHCLVREANASLLRLTPWIDRVLPYRRDQPYALGHHLRMAWELRVQHYDVAIELMGADYSCAVAWISGAPRRLVRNPGNSRRRYGWRCCSTDVMECSFDQEAMYRQKLRCVQQAGFTAPGPVFKLVDDVVSASALGLEAADMRSYIHVSPYAKLARKELPPEQMAQLLIWLEHDFPKLRLVLTCSGKPREREALDRLLAALPFRPWKVFAGTLDIPQLYTLIRGAALHLGGDSGALHLSWLARTPSVSWFRKFDGFNEWVPQGEHHAVVCTSDPRIDALHGLDIDTLLTHARALVAGARSDQT